MCTELTSNEELSNLPSGVSGKPVPGYDIRVLREDNTEAEANEMGRIVIKLPLPPGTMSTLWENDDLFRSTYFQNYPGYYDTADVGYKCDKGFITILSRADDVINVAGHRISCSAIEEVFTHETLPYLIDKLS
jgi:propionyl-CoA synthetase